jgi:hypothetical protein
MKLSPSIKIKIVRGASWLRKEPHSRYRGSEISGCLSDFILFSWYERMIGGDLFLGNENEEKCNRGRSKRAKKRKVRYLERYIGVGYLGVRRSRHKVTGLQGICALTAFQSLFFSALGH